MNNQAQKTQRTMEERMQDQIVNRIWWNFGKVWDLLPYSEQSNDFSFADIILQDDLYTFTAREYLKKDNKSAQIVEFKFVKYINNVKQKLQSSQPSPQSEISSVSTEYVTIFYNTQK